MQDEKSGTCLKSCGVFMEPCLTPSCDMGIVREAIDQQDGSISQTLCTASCLRKPHWDGQNNTVVEGLGSADIGLSNTEPAVAPGVESCLQEEWPEQQSSCCKKRHLEDLEEELLPKQLRGQEGEIGHVEMLGMFSDAFLAALSWQV